MNSTPIMRKQSEFKTKKERRKKERI
jgi:hypothetical protein